MSFDYILTVCDHAHENRPYIPSKNAKWLRHYFYNPCVLGDRDQKKHEVLLKVREEIKDYFQRFF